MVVHSPNIWNMGWVEVICGSMFSGKTEELIQRLKRAQIAKQKIQIFKPEFDTRFSHDHVTSHSELKLDARNIKDPEDILAVLDDNTRVVGIDEVQFLAPSIVEITQRLANRGLRVIVAGLDLDYRGQPFGPMPLLMAVAEFVTKMSAICVVCGNTASRTQRKRIAYDHESKSQNLFDKGSEGKIVSDKDAKNEIMIGAEEIYEARCRSCFESPA